MKNNVWSEVTVDEIKDDAPNALATGPFGSSISSRYFQGSGVPVIRGSNLSNDVGKRIINDGLVFLSREKANEFKRSVAKRGDLVFTCWGTIGQVGLIDEKNPYDEYIVSNKQMKLSPDPKKADSLFLYYVFSSEEISNQIKQRSIGSSVPGFNLGQLRSIRIPLPPLYEQHVIAGTLGMLDDKIEVNRHMNATLESMARTIYRQWFVENSDATKWELLRIRDFGDLDKGVSYKGAFLTDEGMPMINLGCFQGKGKFSIENLKTYSGEYKERHTVKPGDIVLANTDITQKREVIGSPAIVPDYPAKEYLFTHHTYALRVKDNSPALKNYLYFTLLQEEFRERAEGFATGTTVLALPRDAVLDYEISTPPPELLQKFYEQVHPMLQKVQSNIKESRTLASLRDSLLPKLMRGEVRVKV